MHRISRIRLLSSLGITLDGLIGNQCLTRLSVEFESEDTNPLFVRFTDMQKFYKESFTFFNFN